MNLFQNIGNWIETKGLSWIFPSRNESTNESCNYFIGIALLLPLACLLLIARLLTLIYVLIVGNKHKDGEKEIYEDNQTKRHISSILLGLAISIVLVFAANIMRKEAKEINTKCIESRNMAPFSHAYLGEYFPDDLLMNNVFYSVYDALNYDHSSQEIVKMKSLLNIDKEFAQNIHFRHAGNFAEYIYSLKGIDPDAEVYLEGIDNIGILDNNFYEFKFYREGALRDFEEGNYYQAADKAEHYFKIYNNQKDFPLSSVDNKMHMLRLLLRGRWDLSTNRRFADKAFSYFNTYYEPDLTDCAKLKEISNNQKFLNNISTYYEGLNSFHKNDYLVAINSFEDCYKNTTDTLLQQYCALMCIRSAFWNYDSDKSPKKLVYYKNIFNKYVKTINLPYFIADIERYQNVVEELSQDAKHRKESYYSD